MAKHSKLQAITSIAEFIWNKITAGVYDKKNAAEPIVFIGALAPDLHSQHYLIEIMRVLALVSYCY